MFHQTTDDVAGHVIGRVARSRMARDDVTRLVVALSGGMDSVSLLHGVVKAGFDKPVSAIHVNHGLQGGAAGFASSSESFCQSLCQGWQVPLTVCPVEVDPVGNLEANARVARYTAFESYLQAGDLLLLAHHADDQIETALLRLFRGSRLHGLQGMPEARTVGRARLYRPLLNTSHRALLQYARTRQLEWVEDPTNLDLTLDRNWLRHKVIPLLEQRWPGVKALLFDTIIRDQGIQDRLAGQARALLRTVSVTEDSLDLAQLRALEPEIFDQVLDAWLSGLGLPLPGGKWLTEMRARCLASAIHVITHGGIELRAHQGCLYALRPLPPLHNHRLPEELAPGNMPVPGGSIATVAVAGEGLRADRPYQLRYRVGGEKLKIRHQRTLKNLFQEAAAPVWLRDRLPLLLHKDEPVALAAIPSWNLPMYLADGWAAKPERAGWQVSLLPDDRLV